VQLRLVPRLCCPGQEAQQLLADVAWPVDRLTAEVADLRRHAEADGAAVAAGGGRDVGDVDAELEDLEVSRATHERAKDEAVRRRARLRCTAYPYLYTHML